METKIINKIFNAIKYNIKDKINYCKKAYDYYNNVNKLYVICLKDLSNVYACVQGGHAVAQYILDNKNNKNHWENNTIVYVYNKYRLEDYIKMFDKCSIWREPDYENKVTAIAAWSKDLKYEYINKINELKTIK